MQQQQQVPRPPQPQEPGGEGLQAGGNGVGGTTAREEGGLPVRELVAPGNDMAWPSGTPQRMLWQSMNAPTDPAAHMQQVHQVQNLHMNVSGPFVLLRVCTSSCVDHLRKLLKKLPSNFSARD